MKTTTKFLIGAVAVIGLYFYFKKRKASTGTGETEAPTGQKETSTVIKKV